jgi:hypothetical protein
MAHCIINLIGLAIIGLLASTIAYDKSTAEVLFIIAFSGFAFLGWHFLNSKIVKKIK